MSETIADLLAIFEAFEWAGAGIKCPWCRNTEVAGHKSGCWVAWRIGHLGGTPTYE